MTAICCFSIHGNRCVLLWLQTSSDETKDDSDENEAGGNHGNHAQLSREISPARSEGQGQEIQEIDEDPSNLRPIVIDGSNVAMRCVKNMLLKSGYAELIKTLFIQQLGYFI